MRALADSGGIDDRKKWNGMNDEEDVCLALGGAADASICHFSHRGLVPAALHALKEAERLDPTYADRVAAARASRRATEDASDSRPALEADPVEPAGEAPARTPLAELVGAELSGQLSPGPANEVERAKVRAIYNRFGALVAEEMGPAVTLVSSADETAYVVRDELRSLGLLRDAESGAREPAEHRFLSSGDISWFADLGGRLLGPELRDAAQWHHDN